MLENREKRCMESYDLQEDINRALEHIDDTDIIELCENVLEDLVKMSDKEFETLEFERAE